MASPAQSPPASGASISSAQQGSYQIVRTGPDEILRHDIGDDELTRLGEGQGGHLGDAFWAFLGAALGGATGGLGGLFRYLDNPTEPISSADLFQIVFLFVMAALAAGAGLALKMQGNPTKSLKEQIRARSKTTTP